MIVLSQAQHVALLNAWLAALYAYAGQVLTANAILDNLAMYLAQEQGINLGVSS